MGFWIWSIPVNAKISERDLFVIKSKHCHYSKHFTLSQIEHRTPSSWKGCSRYLWVYSLSVWLFFHQKILTYCWFHSLSYQRKIRPLEILLKNFLQPTAVLHPYSYLSGLDSSFNSLSVYLLMAGLSNFTDNFIYDSITQCFTY